jgi:hypothetical protein
MDVHGVSGNPHFFELFLKQKQSLRDALSYKGQQSKGRKSRDELIHQFRFGLMMRQGRADSNNFYIRSSHVPPAYTPCSSPLCELTKVMIKDLLPETHHRGTYLLLCSITPPDIMTAVMSIAEDEKKDVLMLALHHRVPENERAMEEILGEGTILIVKEPYLKLMSDGDYGIRIDHLSNTDQCRFTT